jgi:hypothetical protein
LRLALRLGESRRIARALAAECGFCAASGGRGATRAHQLLARLRTITGDLDDPEWSLFALAIEGAVDYVTGEFAACVSKLQRIAEIGREQWVGATFEVNNARMYRISALAAMGRWGELQRTVDAYLLDAQRRGDRFIDTSMRRVANIRWLARDDPTEARRELAATSWTPPERGYHVQQWLALLARCYIAVYEETAAREWPELLAEFRRMDRSLLMRVQNIRVFARLSLSVPALAAASDAARREPALRFVRAMIRRLRRERVGYATALSCHLEACLAARTGDRARAIELLRRAVALCSDANLEHVVAGDRYWLGRLVGGDEGRALIAQADAWMREQGVVNAQRAYRTAAPGFDEGAAGLLPSGR